MCIRDSYTKDQENIKLAVDAATDWLANVKIEDKEAVVIQDYTMPVSYTHLDVYKRQFPG